uniref:RphB protein n=1 Tax=Streptomyces griseoviridis TaxID=45398 RepID=A0A0S3TWA8_STRGD|nr:rphB [Streptomyces griseoviridis]
MLLPTAAAGWAAVPGVRRLLLWRTQQSARLSGRRILWSGGDPAAFRDAARDAADTVVQSLSLALLALTACAVALLFLYDWLAHALFGRTLGKLCLGVTVVRSGGGGPPGPLRALLRSAVLTGLPGALLCWYWLRVLLDEPPGAVPYLLLLCLPVLGALLLLGPARRPLHDRLSRTCVTRTR